MGIGRKVNVTPPPPTGSCPLTPMRARQNTCLARKVPAKKTPRGPDET